MTVHQLKTEYVGADKPGLEYMCSLLEKNRSLLDPIDNDFLNIIQMIEDQGLDAKIEAVEEARAIGWSMLTRNRIHG